MSNAAHSREGHGASPWNKGRKVGQKRALRRQDVRKIRGRLRAEGHKRDLALFNLAIDIREKLFPVHPSGANPVRRLPQPVRLPADRGCDDVRGSDGYEMAGRITSRITRVGGTHWSGAS